MAPRRRKRLIPRLVPDEPDDLFALLLEQAVPSTPEAWFQPPWKDGRNAVWLGARLIEVLFDASQQTPSQTPAQTPSQTIEGIIQFVEDATATLDLVEAYWTAQDLKQVASVSSEHASTLVAVLDMVQKWASRSDGGGHVYNNILRRICETHLSNGGDVETIEPTVRRWRARDGIGLFPSDENEPSDQTTQRRLHAFESAWMRGLYKIAYCI